ncbi:MAG: glycosyltransferase, partial [Ginsengibacter sp.]
IGRSLFENKISERIIDVAGAGSLIPLKQYDLFIDVIAELKNNLPNIKSVIAGKGSEEKLLQQKIEHAAITNNISLAGEISYADVLSLMQQSKIFLHPSSYEGFSMVCQEALYAGCHVISFCKPMNTDFNHWHVVKSKEEMTKKALKILLQSGLKYEAVMPYSINDTANSIMKLYEH